ncbi:MULTISPECIES: PadR family transcriptional regulator [Leuconostoc]|uniref:PadR family transcriptional regulator n=1 Tax=Leuconostoc TaxID=1243 RepID=UPI0002738309|nr:MULTISPECIES: PadR family transcriptional regulator [Leuconostoc]KDA48566.1 Transcriptional regulator, PadR family [Leuconostoc pseudomesenteroides 1159]KDA50363.1 Transcriptional regulator, PadR family [Leuconostoc pseudomesenteroides PS12]OQJ68091.1 PadR family transcriptional regulator [Leuconostoc pseudomesenteroides]CCJ67290.1 Transcriptional regulator, PadR family [Leuconostoc pseudomesenteroides 4882]AKP36895.1 PadR family transcriptional regulator [Leuconostoc mesenteroides subsp. d
MPQNDISSQMLKGILQGCLLILINQRPYYGYAISQELSRYGFADVPKGTIYPLLMSMEKKGLIIGKMQPSKDGPQRKYYHITATGKQARQIFLNKWDTLSLNVNDLINERRNDS